MAQDIPATASGRGLDLDEIVARIAGCRDEITSRGATSLHIFGSRARGDARSDSDLDVLVDYDRDGRFSIIGLAGIKLLLERATGLEVHITTANSIPASSRPAIDRDAIRVI